MDVNGTRFHLLLGRRDWARCADGEGRSLEQLWKAGDEADTAWDAERDEISLRPLPFLFPEPKHDRPPALGDRRGADADRFGNVYWIDEPRTGVLVRSVGTGRTTKFWSSEDAPCPPPRRRRGTFGPLEEPPPRTLPLAGLAVTEDHYLVAGCVEPPGLLIFDLVGGGPPSFLTWPTAEFEPFDLARRPGGGVWVLDARHRRAWELERDFRVHTVGAAAAQSGPGAFAPVEGVGARPSETGRLTVTNADAIDVAGEPVAIAAAADGVLVLDRDPDGPSSLLTFYRRGRPPLTAATAGRESPPETATSTRGHDFAFVPDDTFGTAYVVDDRGNQSYAFALSLGEEELEAELRAAYFPMRLFGGKGLVVAPGGVLYDFADGWIPLVSQPRARHVETGTIVTARYDPATDTWPMPPFDGREPGCVWHRLFLDGCLEPGSSVRVWSAAADDQAALARPDWQPEPTPGRRASGIEVPFAELLDGYDTHELLFQRAKGRYLVVKLELRGDGRVTPRIRALRASFPRFSYLERYLPAVFREDPVSASFLDRFLANVEGFYTTIEDTIAAGQVLLEPSATPTDALDWLAGWFDATLDPGWDDPTRRLFLRHAVDLFRRRGTTRGVELALLLGLEGRLEERDLVEAARPGERRARVVEAFRARRTPGVIWGDPTDLGGPRVRTRNGWTPDGGRVALDEAYRAHLERGGESPDRYDRFPLAPPEGRRGELWQRFAEETLGFVPGEAPPVVERAWRRFLTRRYPNVDALNAAYGLVGDDRLDAFEHAPWPGEVPDDGAPLLDWFQFSSVVLPMRRRAHRFTVLLPVRVGTDLPDVDPYELRRRAERIVRLQKPAHTVFDIRFFWAAFRIGEARLGADTLIDLGSRAPELLEPLVLGREHLGETYLGGEPPADRIRRPLVASPDHADQELP
jgi:phage tail-like protein